MMERNWLKLETIQEFWDEHKLNREQLIEWENQHSQHKDSIIHPLYELNESLEDQILDLFSYVETTIRIRSLMPDGETSVILDERFSKEIAAYDKLSAALSKLRGEVKGVKECLDDPLGSIRKSQLNLQAANTHNEELRQEFRDLEVQYKELENCFYSRGELEDQIKVLELSVREKDIEIARVSEQSNELRFPRSPQQITEIVNSADNLTISDESNIICKLEKEKKDLLKQLQMVIRERDVARRDKEIMQEVFKSNEDSRGKLREENNTLCKQVASLKAQRQPASPASLSTGSAGRRTSVGSLQLSGSSMTHVPREQAATSLYTGSNAPSTPVRQSPGSFGNRNFSPISLVRNNNRRISSASPLSRSRSTLTRTQERVIATVQQLPDDQLEKLESGGAFESVSIKRRHWVKGHWRRNRGQE